MSACSGREIMTEVLGHLGAQREAETILSRAICIPCMMPFITSQFLPRAKGDRSDVIPKGTENLAFIGQYCELPEDVVFTVEYSIRSAQTAVCDMLKLNRKPPPVYHGKILSGTLAIASTSAPSRRMDSRRISLRGLCDLLVKKDLPPGESLRHRLW